MGIGEILRRYKRIAVDTNVFIAVLAGEAQGEKILPLIEAVADKGTHEMITSVLSFAECAVKPYRDANWLALDQVRLMFLMPNLKMQPMDGVVAEEAARLRGIYGFKMPDAIVAATAVVSEAEALLTNDRQLTVLKEIAVLTFDDL
jgi:predicted nucleic acid-binding protein